MLGEVDLLEALLQRGANPAVFGGSQGVTPLHYLLVSAAAPPALERGLRVLLSNSLALAELRGTGGGTTGGTVGGTRGCTAGKTARDSIPKASKKLRAMFDQVRYGRGTPHSRLNMYVDDGVEIQNHDQVLGHCTVQHYILTISQDH